MLPTAASIALWLPLAACGGTVVVANRTAEPIAFQIVPGQNSRETGEQVLPPGQLVSIAIGPGSTLRRAAAAGPQEYELEVDSAYLFHREAADAPEPRFDQIGLLGAADELEVRRSSADERPSERNKPAGSAAVLPKILVKLLVDDEERASQRAWQQRLRKRLAEASQLLQRQARVIFEVESVGVWDSDDANQSFPQALREFEQEVDPQPARLAIGFTSQYALTQGRTNLGGTRGPLRRHILLREWSQHVSEPERLELLIHELGHFLGAAHSPEAESVMRPILGDRQALARRFAISFDPLNALAMSLVGEHLGSGELARLDQLPAVRRRRLGEIYLTLARSLPEDPAARHYLHWASGGTLPLMQPPQLHREQDEPLADVPPQATPPAKPQSPPQLVSDAVPQPAPQSPEKPRPPSPQQNAQPSSPSATAQPPLQAPRGTETDPPDLVTASRRVVAAVVAAARRNANLPAGGSEETSRVTGDRLTEFYVRTAAREAAALEEKLRPRALVIGLAVALDTSDTLRTTALSAPLWRQIESDEERAARLPVVGLPTMRERYDLTQHFFVSAALATMVGGTAAEAVGLTKELRDAQGGSGFSFSDVCADLAGIALAQRLSNGKIRWTAMENFQVDLHLPKLDDLADGLSASEFYNRYGSLLDPRCQRQLDQIRQRIAELAPANDNQ